MASFSQLIVKITADSTAFVRGIRSAQKEALSMAEKFEAAGSVLTRAVSLPLGLLGGAALKSAADFEGLRRGLEAVSGSAAAAERQFASLKKVAELPGLGFREAVQGSINLQAAGFSAATAERALKAFGNALATVGKGRAELDGVILALSQIQAKGKFSAEELNQLAERLPQIRQAVKQAFGTGSTEEIQKLGLTSEQIIGKIIEQFEKLPQVSGGLKNSFENVRDSLERTAAAFGELLSPAAQAATDFLADFAANAEKAASAAKALPQPVKDTAVGIAALAASAGLVSASISGFARLATVIGGVASAIAGPFGLAATALIANFGNIIARYRELRYELENDAFLKAILRRFPEMTTAAQQTASDLRFFAQQSDEVANAALRLSFSQAQTSAELKNTGVAAQETAKTLVLMKAIDFADKSKDNELFAASIASIEREADRLKSQLEKLREFADRNPFAEIGDGPSIVNGVDNFAKLVDGASKFNTSLLPLETRTLRFVEALGKVETQVKRNRDILDFVNAGGVGNLPSNLGNSTSTIPSLERPRQELTAFQRQVSTVVTDFSRGIADIIVKGESVGKVFRGIGEQIATALIRVAVEKGIKVLINSLDGVISKLGTLGRAFSDVFGSVAGTASTGVQAATGAAGAAGAAGSAAGAAGSAAFSGVGGAVTAIGSIATAVFSALQFFQGRRMEQDIGRIEVTSRQIFNQLLAIQERLDQYLPNLLNTAYLAPIDEKLTRLYDGLSAVSFPGTSGGNTINITINGFGNNASQVANDIIRELRLRSAAFA